MGYLVKRDLQHRTVHLERAEAVVRDVLVSHVRVVLRHHGASDRRQGFRGGHTVGTGFEDDLVGSGRDGPAHELYQSRLDGQASGRGKETMAVTGYCYQVV